MSALRAYYYPFNVIGVDTLKYLALYFDEVIVQAELADLEEDVKYWAEQCREHGIDEPPSLERFDNPADAALGLPPASAYFLGRYSLFQFLESTKVLQQEGVLRVDDRWVFAGPAGEGGLALSPTQVMSFAEESDTVDDLAPAFYALGANSAFTRSAVQQEVRKDGSGISARQLIGFQIGVSISNAGAHNAQLVTDNERVEGFLTDFQRRHIVDRNPDPHRLAVRTFEQILPALSFSSFEEILEVRREFKDELLEFRDTVTDYVAKLRGRDGVVGADEAERSFARRVSKEIASFEDRARRSRRKLLRKLVLGAALAAPPALVSRLYPDLPIGAAAGLSTLVAGATGIDAAFEFSDSMSELNRSGDVNGVSFLLKARRALRKA